jgi:amino acid permease
LTLKPVCKASYTQRESKALYRGSADRLDLLTMDGEEYKTGGNTGGGSGQNRTPLMQRAVQTPLQQRRGAYEGSGTISSSVFTLANSAIGAGILAFPFAFKSAGLTLGIVLCLSLAVVMAMSLHFIIYSLEKAQKADPRIRTYQDLVQAAAGDNASMFIEVTMVVYLFGACLGFVIIIGDMLHPILANTGIGFLESRNVCICLVTLGVIFPLCTLRKISALQFSSTLAVAAVLFMVCMMIHEFTDGAHKAVGKTVLIRENSEAILSIPLICFALQCHIQGPMIYSELKPHLQNLKVMDLIIVAAIGTCLVLYIPAGIFGDLSFGDNTQQDILDIAKKSKDADGNDTGYAVTDRMAEVARICIAICACCGFPLNHFPARSALFGLVQRYYDRRDRLRGIPPIQARV